MMGLMGRDGLKDDPDYVEVGLEDLLDQPDPITDQPPGEDERIRVSVLPVHSPGQISHQEAGEGRRKPEVMGLKWPERRSHSPNIVRLNRTYRVGRIRS